MKAPLLLVTLSVALASPCAFAAKDSAKPAPAAGEKPKAPSATGYTVKAGDNLAKIARALATTSDNLAKANGLTSDAIIRPGQTLKIPAKTSAKAAPATKPPSAPVTQSSANTHQVQAGETFSSISKKHGISAAALAAANPTAIPTALKLGQILSLNVATPPKPTKPAPDAASQTPPPAAVPAPKEKTAARDTPTPTQVAEKAPPAPRPLAKPPVPAAPVSAPRESKPVVEATKSPEPAPSAAPLPAAAQAPAGPKYVTATVDSETTLGEFAAKHGADAKRLNELNGLDLTTETVLAKGSELIVPIQP